MAHIYLYRDGDQFVARVNRGLRGAESHHFDSRAAAEAFAHEHVGPTGNIRSVLDMTDEEIERHEAFNRRAYNG